MAALVACVTAMLLVPPPPPATWCHGIVLWFDTGFTDRFCKEKPVVLSTSPCSTPIHCNRQPSPLKSLSQWINPLFICTCWHR